MRSESHRVAARLGLDEPTIRRLKARGHPERLALSESQIRARLYHAYLAHLQSHADAQVTTRDRTNHQRGGSA